jgi:hypothetical protein
MRKIDSCLNCGEEREMAAHGLCFACYRRHERAQDRARIDRHTPAMRREHKKILRGFMGVMVGLGDLGVQKADMVAIRRMLEPYVTPISQFLAPTPEVAETQGPVNSEPNSEKLFTGRGVVQDQDAEG